MYKHLRSAFDERGVHGLNMALLEASGLEIPEEATESSRTLLTWLRSSPVNRTVAWPQDFVLPAEPPSWASDRDPNWIAAEDQFIWVAALVGADDEGDPMSEILELQLPGEPDLVLERLPLSELLMRILFERRGHLRLTSATPTLGGFRHHAGSTFLAPPRVGVTGSWGAMAMADDWVARHDGNAMSVFADDEELARREVADLADDWELR